MEDCSIAGVHKYCFPHSENGLLRRRRRKVTLTAAFCGLPPLSALGLDLNPFGTVNNVFGTVKSTLGTVKRTFGTGKYIFGTVIKTQKSKSLAFTKEIYKFILIF